MNPFPTVEDIAAAFPYHDANLAHDLLTGEADAADYCEDNGLLRHHFNTPRGTELVLMALDHLLDTHGVEVIRNPEVWDRYYGDGVASYLNTGDTYSPTIIFDHDAQTFVVTSWGDYVEAMEAEAEDA